MLAGPKTTVPPGRVSGCAGASAASLQSPLSLMSPKILIDEISKTSSPKLKSVMLMLEIWTDGRVIGPNSVFRST